MAGKRGGGSGGGYAAPSTPPPPHYGPNPTNTIGVGGNSTSGVGGPAVGQYPTGGYPAPAAPSNPVPSSGGGWDPNAWKSDPGYLMALAAQQQGNTQLDAWLKQGRTSALIDFGDPTLAIPGFNLDPQTRAMIQQNYKSGNAQLARLDQNHALGLKSVINQLAGRGLLFSGDTGYLQNQQDQLYGHNVYDARNALLSSLSNQYQQYLQQRQALQSQVISAAQAAYANAANQLMNSGY